MSHFIQGRVQTANRYMDSEGAGLLIVLSTSRRLLLSSTLRPQRGPMSRNQRNRSSTRYRKGERDGLAVSAVVSSLWTTCDFLVRSGVHLSATVYAFYRNEFWIPPTIVRTIKDDRHTLRGEDGGLLNIHLRPTASQFHRARLLVFSKYKFSGYSSQAAGMQQAP